MRLVPRDAEKERLLAERLENSMYRDVDFFIATYNQGLLNKSHEEVVDIAREIKNTYKNVRLRDKNFSFKPADQMFFEGIVEKFESWEPVITMKNDILFFADMQNLRDDSIVNITKNKAFYIDPETGKKIRIDTNAFNERGVERILPHSSFHNKIREDESYDFYVSDFRKIDVSFIEKLEELIPESPSRTTEREPVEEPEELTEDSSAESVTQDNSENDSHNNSEDDSHSNLGQTPELETEDEEGLPSF